MASSPQEHGAATAPQQLVLHDPEHLKRTVAQGFCIFDTCKFVYCKSWASRLYHMESHMHSHELPPAMRLRPPEAASVARAYAFICNRTVTDVDMTHLRALTCPICLEPCTTKIAMKSHLSAHSRKFESYSALLITAFDNIPISAADRLVLRANTCVICSEPLSSKQRLHAHLNRHTADLPVMSQAARTLTAPL